MCFKKISQSKFFKLYLFLIFIILCVALSRYFKFNLAESKKILLSYPLVLSGLIFIILYVGSTTIVWFGPKDILRVAAALIYGAYISTVLVYIGEMLNLIIMFSMARALGRDFVAKQLKGKLQQLDENIAQTSFLSIFFLKLIPIVSYRVLDLFFGITKISLKKYFLISLLAAPVRLFFVQFVLSLGLDVALNPEKLREYFEAHPLALWLNFIYMVVSIVAVIIWRYQAKNKRLNKA
jgi:uncharacterized membrane protein YdjX (TVP38/TMEM64 family)